MKRSLRLVLAVAALASGGPLSAQLSIPDIPFDAVDPLKFPDDIHLGEAAGVATNSKGDLFVFTRTGNPVITLGTSRAVSHGGSRLFQFDRTGKFVREIGEGAYGFLFAQQVRVDPQDNIWVVDQMSTQVMKVDPNGRIQLILSRKPEAMRVPALGPTPPPAPAGESFQCPTDVAWDAAGNIYVSDGYGNARVAKYDRNGKWIKNFVTKRAAPRRLSRASTPTRLPRWGPRACMDEQSTIERATAPNHGCRPKNDRFVHISAVQARLVRNAKLFGDR